MSVPYTPDQLEFRDTLRAFLQEHCSSEFLRKRLGPDSRSKSELYSKLGDELGLQAGFVGADKVFGIRELGIVAYEVGRSLVPDPIVDDLFLKGILPDLVDSAPKLLSNSGTAICRPFCGEYLPCAEGAAVVLSFDNKKISLVDCSSGVNFNAVSSLDLTRPLFSVESKGEKTEVLPDKSSPLVRSAVESLRAIEIAGACSRALEMTVDYIKTRSQFGVPIGSFQSVQHGAADLCLWSEQITALAEFAIWSIQESKEQSPLASRSALVVATSRGGLLIEKAIQLHGGIGFTWEHDLHLYLRRVRSIEALNVESGSAQLELLQRAA